MMRVKKSDPPSAMDGLEGIDKRVGSWGKKKQKEEKEKKQNCWNNSKRVGSWGKKKQTNVPKAKSCNQVRIFGVVLVEYKQLAPQRH